MALMKTRRYIIVRRLSRALTINLHAPTVAASIKVGHAITTTIAETVRTKVKNATPNTKRVHRKNSPVKTSNVSACNTGATAKTIAAIVPTKSIAKKIT